MWDVLLVPSLSPTLWPIYDGIGVNVTSTVTWFHLNHDMVSRRIYKLSFYGGHSIALEERHRALPERDEIVEQDVGSSGGREVLCIDGEHVGPAADYSPTSSLLPPKADSTALTTKQPSWFNNRPHPNPGTASRHPHPIPPASTFQC